MELVKILSLNKSFEDKVVFKDFNATISKRKVNMLLGSSGSGKTTLLKILLGLEDYEGEIVGDLGKVSVVFQENRLIESLSVYDNIKLVYGKGLSREEVEKDLNEVGLYGTIDNKVSQLSGGMKRRVAIVRALIVDAKTYIFDEAFKEIDHKNYELVIEYYKKKTKGKTVIMTSHNKWELDNLSDNHIYIE